MTVQNKQIQDHTFLRGMYDDDYYPEFLVDKIKVVLTTLCEEIEKHNPGNAEALLILTHAATEKINVLAEEFDENDSEIETVARDVIGGDFETIVRAYGFAEVDIEDAIAPRDW